MRQSSPLLAMILLWFATTALAGGEPTAYGLGEPEPLDSYAVAAPETSVVIMAEAAPSASAAAAPEAAAPQPLRIRLIGAQAPVARDPSPLTAGLRYQPSAQSR